MQIKVKDRDIMLIPGDVKLSKRLITTFIENVRKTEEEKQYPNLLFHTMVMMHVLTKDQIEMLTSQSLAKLLNTYYKNYEAKQKAKETRQSNETGQGD